MKTGLGRYVTRCMACAVFGTCFVLAGSLTAIAAASHRAAPTVVVTAGKPSEYSFTLSRSSVAEGPVVFELINDGRKWHGFEIDNHKTKVIGPHGETSITVDFRRPGRYIYQCAEPHLDPAQENIAQIGGVGPCASGLLTVT